jgi:phosphoserine phosphatase
MRHGSGPVLHVFDMDGTLLPGTTASLEIARSFGGRERLHELEQAFRHGLLDTRAFASALHAGWTGLTPEVVRAAFEAAPKLRHIQTTVDALKERGDRAVVITMSPDFFVAHFADYGFDEVVGSRFPALPFGGALDRDGILTFADKPRLVRALCERFGIAMVDVVAYGDSQSDVPLFEVAGASVAVNADDHVSGLASTSYRGDDLLEAYRLGLRALPVTAA